MLIFLRILSANAVQLNNHLKGNSIIVYAHTANAAWFFPVIIVMTSDGAKMSMSH